VRLFLLVSILTVGWCSLDDAIAQPEQKKTAIVVPRWANVRSRPTTSSSIMRKAYEGEELEVLEERDEWVRVQLEEDISGWIFGELLSIVEQNDTVEMPEPSIPYWLYLPGLLAVGVVSAGLVYSWLARKQRIFDYAGRLDRMTSAGYIESVSREDVVRLTRAFGIGDRTARTVARQTYLDRYMVSSSHRRLTEKEKASFRKLQNVLQLSDEEVMRIMAKAYKGRRVEGKTEK
jgi:uncharacterized protein YgiM (DUF1202 family)